METGQSPPYARALLTTPSDSLAAFGLMNGGTAGMIYTYIGGVIGFTAVIASMAEMASMYVATDVR